MYCDKCGQPLPQTKTKYNGWTTTQTLQNTAPLILPDQADTAHGFSEAYRKTPFRKMELTADVLVPLTQAIISGILTVIILALLVPFVPGWGWGVPFIVGGLVVALVWAWSMVKDRGLWVIEEITGIDIDRDGHTGKPQPAKTIEIEIKEQGKLTGLATLPGEYPYLVAFCRWVSAGDSFSESTAQECGYGVTNFRKLRDIFIKDRGAAWRNPEHPQQGLDLTDRGLQIIKGIANSNTPPPTGGAS